MPDLSGGTPSLKALQNGQTTAAAETAAALSEPPVQEIKQTPEQHLPAAAASVSGPSPQPVVSMPAGSPLSAFESEAKVKYLPLSEPNVVKKWNEFAENYRSQASEYAILRNKEPKLDGSQVSVEMTNKLESTQFDKLRLATQAFFEGSIWAFAVVGKHYCRAKRSENDLYTIAEDGVLDRKIPCRGRAAGPL